MLPFCKVICNCQIGDWVAKGEERGGNPRWGCTPVPTSKHPEGSTVATQPSRFRHVPLFQFPCGPMHFNSIVCSTLVLVIKARVVVVTRIMTIRALATQRRFPHSAFERVAKCAQHPSFVTVLLMHFSRLRLHTWLHERNLSIPSHLVVALAGPQILFHSPVVFETGLTPCLACRVRH